MKKYFLLINVIVGFGCNSTQLEKEDILSTSTMVELLIDIHILEARIDKLRISNDSSYMIYNSLERELFESYNLDKIKYERSYRFYLKDAKKMDEIYSIVVDSLNVIEKRGYHHPSEIIKEEEVVEKERTKLTRVSEVEDVELSSEDSLSKIKNGFVVKPVQKVIDSAWIKKRMIKDEAPDSVRSFEKRKN